MRTLVSLALATTLAASSAFAADSSHPLAAGKPAGERCMHEFVLSGEPLTEFGVKTLDIAKRLLDYNYYAPTIYFPTIVHEAIMIEPTETETKATLDEFIATFIKILDEAKHKPDLVKNAPHTTPVGRLNEVEAARKPILKWPRI